MPKQAQLFKAKPTECQPNVYQFLHHIFGGTEH